MRWEQPEHSACAGTLRLAFLGWALWLSAVAGFFLRFRLDFGLDFGWISAGFRLGFGFGLIWLDSALS